jgi:CRISPR-associated endoribonuclease Cas6
MSLISIVLSLVSPNAATLPHNLGRANYTEVLAQLNRVEAGLGAQVHDGNQTKPVTCSDLLNVVIDQNGSHVRPGEAYFVRVTGLTAPVSAVLHQALIVDPPKEWVIGGHRFRVVSATHDAQQHPWAGHATYETLAAGRLIHGRIPGPVLTLQFSSPTAFRSNDMHVPIPMPTLVFGSLAERWNSFSPVPLNSEFRQFAAEQVAVSRYELRSLPVLHKRGAIRIGGIGQVTYTALTEELYWRATVQMLADFAIYSGVGVQTLTGMGQTRRLE